MARRTILYAVTAAALLGVTALALSQLLGTGNGNPADLTGSWLTSSLSQRYRLYSGEKNSVTGTVDNRYRSVELLDSMALPNRRFVISRDGSTEDDVLKPDGLSIKESVTYFKEVSRGAGRHKQARRTYAASSDTVVDEQLFRYDGTPMQHTVSDEMGGQHIWGYGTDGKTLVREVVIAPREYKWAEPVLQKEQRWTDDARHAMVYENLVKPDKSRVISRWDETGLLVMLVTQPPSGVYGTTVIGYFPGTNKLRVEGRATSSMDASYYRLVDGTLDHVLEISPGMLTVKYFDSTGKKIRREQAWWRTRETVDGVRKSVYLLYWAKEFAPDGTQQRDFTYQIRGPQLGFIELDNVQINGQTFAEVDYNYDKDTGYLTMVRYWKTTGHGADIEEPHKLDEKIVAPPVPSVDIKMGVDPDEDDLPVPPPQRGPYGN